MLKSFNFILAYITAITKSTYLQSSKKKEIKNKKEVVYRLRMRSRYITYSVIAGLRGAANGRNLENVRLRDRFSGKIWICALLDSTFHR